MASVLRKIIPTAVRQKIKSHLINRHKVRLFGDLAPLVPAAEQMFDGPQSLAEQPLQLFPRCPRARRPPPFTFRHSPFASGSGAIESPRSREIQQ